MVKRDDRCRPLDELLEIPRTIDVPILSVATACSHIRERRYRTAAEHLGAAARYFERKARHARTRARVMRGQP